MPFDRAKVAESLVRELAERPATAQELVSRLSRRPDWNGLQVSDLNSILYTELSDRVTLDRGQTWSLDKRHHLPAERTAVADRASRLRAILRMRAGLPPTDCLESLTIHGDTFTKAFSALLNRQPNCQAARWMLVSGDYGEGKSHALALFRELAVRNDYASCQVSCDAWSSALNHPQRCVSRLFATLEVPGRQVRGYDDLLEGMLRDQTLAPKIRTIAARHLTGGRTIEIETRHHLDDVVALLRGNQPSETAELARHIRTVSAHLTGETIRHRSASPDVRELSYRLLRIAGELLRATGTRGVCLLVDEVESMYTKLFNARSRRGAYRVLAALCESNQLHDWNVFIATTPDAHRLFATELQLVRPEYGDLKCESISDFAHRLLGPSLVHVRCKPFKRADQEKLLTRIVDVYCEAYTISRDTLPDGDWQHFLSESFRAQLPARLLVRHAIDYMDARRYAAQS